MTKDELIKLAEQCGAYPVLGFLGFTPDTLEAFAAALAQQTESASEPGADKGKAI